MQIYIVTQVQTSSVTTGLCSLKLKGQFAQRPNTPIHKITDPRLFMIQTDPSCAAGQQRFRAETIAEGKMSPDLVAYVHFDET